MIKAINDLSNAKKQEELIRLFEQWHKEISLVLPGVPKDIQIYFDDWPMMPEFGVGGFAYGPTILTVAFDLKFNGDKKQQIKDLKSTFYHECYHLAQGFYGGEGHQDSTVSLLDTAVYEGAATAFERDYTGSNWCIYEDDKTMQLWLTEVRNHKATDDYRKLKFYDPATGRRWVVYKVGLFIIDQALRKKPAQTIVALVGMKPEQILRLADVS